MERIRFAGHRLADDEQAQHVGVHRLLTAVAALSLLWGAESAYSAGARYAILGIASVIGFMGAIGVVIGALIAKDSRALFKMDLLLLIVSIVVLAAWVGGDFLSNPAYRTDEEIFVQYGAHLMSQGKNPYGADMRPAFQMFPLPPQQFTPRLDGTFPADMGYPALPMILTYLANFFTGGFHTIILLNLLAAGVAAVLAFIELPTRFRPLGVILTVGMPGLVLHIEFGFIQVLMLPFLLAAFWKWFNIGKDGRLGASGIARAVCLGLAVSIQQLAWFTIPFLLVGLYLLRRSELDRNATLRVMLRYVLVAAGTFAAVNLPFAVTAPGAWLKGITEPLTQHAIPMGNGLIGLTQALGLGSGNLSYYSNGALLLLVTLLAAYALYFRLLGPAVTVLPFCGLLFSARSLAAYFVPLAVLWGVSIVSADRDVFTQAPQLLATRLTDLRRRLIVLGSAVPSAALILLAMATPSPLKVSILDTKFVTPLHAVQQITVKVTNTTGKPITPHFLTSSTQLYASTFWTPTGGPATLAPHQTATYTLTGTSQVADSFATDNVKIMAVSDNPPAVSWSPVRTNYTLVAALDATPDNTRYAPGTPVTLRVQLRDQETGRDVHKAGVPILMSEHQYTPGAAPGKATVNGVNVGSGEATALTDASGMAVFTVECDSPQALPTFFQASIQGKSLSYTFVVPILWQ
jgi:uncharacterized membrane protein